MRGRGGIGRRCRLKIGFHRSAGSSPAVRTIALAASLALAACDHRPDSGPVIVSAIGSAPIASDARRGQPDLPSRLLTDSLAQGLVRFDAAGQIEPGLAERWTVIDDGMSYIFRLRDAEWPEGARVTADEVVAILKREIGPGSRNPLAPFLTAIDSIVVMTPQVIEIRLQRPRPDLLKLFAQPEMALLRIKPVGGSGPFRVLRGGRNPLMRPAVDPDRAHPDDDHKVAAEDEVHLIGERTARALIRFVRHGSDLVSGGTFADWPMVAASGAAPANIRLDPAAGLFGLAVTDRTGFLGDPANRGAVAQALDRDAILGAVSAGWAPTTQVLPEQLDSAAPPAIPSWSQGAAADRIAQARARVAAWRSAPVTLRIAIAEGPGGTILFGRIAASLMAIGIVPVRVALGATADLRLVDRVAPYDSARWYLATACVACSDVAQRALDEARMAPTLTERAQRIAVADAALTQDVAFIPLGRPLRWSLVAMRLAAWQPNARAWHPLNRLRAVPN